MLPGGGFAYEGGEPQRHPLLSTGTSHRGRVALDVPYALQVSPRRRNAAVALQAPANSLAVEQPPPYDATHMIDAADGLIALDSDNGEEPGVIAQISDRVGSAGPVPRIGLSPIASGMGAL